ncbi:Rz1-like lysis system protein LysC [Citrobacter freundii]
MQKTRSHWSHREPRLISTWLLRVVIALVGMFLLQLLTGCGNTRIVYVPVPQQPVPSNLIAETPQPYIPDLLTYGASLDLNVSLLSALGQCNQDKAAVRQIEDIRRSTYAIAN